MIFKRTIHPITQGVIDSLERSPGKWKQGEFYLYLGGGSEHSGKVSFWIANGCGHVKIKKPWEKELKQPDRRALWKAFTKWEATTSTKSFERFLAILLEAEENTSEA